MTVGTLIALSNVPNLFIFIKLAIVFTKILIVSNILNEHNVINIATNFRFT